MSIAQQDTKTPIDMIAQAGEILAGYAKSHYAPTQQDGTVVLASAVLAVSGELRELRNAVAELRPVRTAPRFDFAGQMGLLHDWLQTYEPGLWQRFNEPSANLILEAIQNRDAEIDGLRQELTQADADNASLIQRLRSKGGDHDSPIRP